MSMPLPPSIIAFEGYRLIAKGVPADVALALKTVWDRGPRAPVLTFDVATSMPVEFDLRGSADDILARVAARITQPGSETTAEKDEPRKAGRPKLGVVGREVTLLPRHWDWLASQSGGASVALRRLVDQARKTSVASDMTRASTESAYRFMSSIGGNLPDFEDASRALFAGDFGRFDRLIETWPIDVRDHLRTLAHRGEGTDEGQAAGPGKLA
jgi:hypothetical protein